MKVEIIPVTNRKLQKHFFQLPLSIYSQDELAKVIPLKKIQNMFNANHNPFLKHILWQNFLAVVSDKPVGRITASFDLLFPDKSTGFFGFWETIPQAQVAQALLQAAEQWLRSQGKKQVIGPIALSTYNHLGLLIQGRELPNPFHLSYNPPYYQDLIEQAGYAKLLDLYCYQWSSRQMPSPRLLKISSRLKKAKNVNIRPISYRALKAETEAILTIYNSAMVHNWGYVPLTLPEARHIILTHRQQVPPGYFLLAEVKGVPAGLCLAIPDFNSGCLRLALLAVRPEFSHLGLSALLLTELMNRALRDGLQRAELSYVAEQNQPVNNLIRQEIGNQTCKRYRLYQKNL